MWFRRGKDKSAKVEAAKTGSAKTEAAKTEAKIEAVTAEAVHGEAAQTNHRSDSGKLSSQHIDPVSTARQDVKDVLVAVNELFESAQAQSTPEARPGIIEHYQKVLSAIKALDFSPSNIQPPESGEMTRRPSILRKTERRVRFEEPHESETQRLTLDQQCHVVPVKASLPALPQPPLIQPAMTPEKQHHQVPVKSCSTAPKAASSMIQEPAPPLPIASFPQPQPIPVIAGKEAELSIRPSLPKDRGDTAHGQAPQHKTTASDTPKYPPAARCEDVPDEEFVRPVPHTQRWSPAETEKLVQLHEAEPLTRVSDLAWCEKAAPKIAAAAGLTARSARAVFEKLDELREDEAIGIDCLITNPTKAQRAELNRWVRAFMEENPQPEDRSLDMLWLGELNRFICIKMGCLAVTQALRTSVQWNVSHMHAERGS